jgi:nitrite reductase/ring-hydroxylating ferredoxin subunit
MFANVGALVLFAAARAGRRDEDARAPRWWALAAEVCGAGLLAAGGWMGGTLVTRNQISIDHRYADAGKWRVEALPEDAIGPDGIDAGAADELQVDQMKLLRVGHRRIVLARTEAGFAAFDDRCTHRGGPLSDGTLACGTVQCPWHGSQFDVRSGAVKHGPAEHGIAVYDVSERDGRVWVRIPPEQPDDEAQFSADAVGAGASPLGRG